MKKEVRPYRALWAGLCSNRSRKSLDIVAILAVKVTSFGIRARSGWCRCRSRKIANLRLKSQCDIKKYSSNRLFKIDTPPAGSKIGSRSTGF